MELPPQKLAEILAAGNYVSSEDLKKAVEYTAKSKSSLIDYLLSNGLITKDLIGQAVAEFLGVPYSDLNSNPPAKEQILLIPEGIARKYRVLIFGNTEKRVVLATSDPQNQDMIKELDEWFQKNNPAILNKTFALSYSTPEDIEEIFSVYRKSLEARFKTIIEEEGDAPSIVEEVLKDAYTYKSSDVHFEPLEDDVVIRFRIDGVLIEAGRLSKDLYEKILNRIKVWAQMRIDEHFAAQDGAIRHKSEEMDVDLRVSVVPTVNGEKIALRVLARYVGGLALGDLGLSEANQKVVAEASKKPFGIIIVSGPTGSGKTTTLYSILKLLNNPETNITTIEDPVEYRIAGVNQIQVNLQTNLTFAKGLRSIVRQDPDIILVGEIRDQETSEIAINAALTGHLLLSTFHANDAPTVVPRLLDMGAEPFLLASTLELIVAQRLVRKLCDKCRYSEVVKVDSLKNLLPDARKYLGATEVTLYKGKGCEACNQSGFKGRTGVFEIIPVTREIEDMIMHRPSANEIWDLASRQGVRSMFEDGLDKVLSGVTTIEELLRVASPRPAESKKEKE